MIDYKEIRHALHQHPQTAGNEQFAHDMIVRHLQGLHPDKVYTHVGGYGIIAVWQSETSHPSPLTSHLPTIAFRADTDALPIGHRCGHDGHTTILLRLAELVDSLTCRLVDPLTCRPVDPLTCRPVDYNILLLWQPAEETGTGARALLESGILQQYNIKALYALHNLPGYPLGTVVLCPKTFAAASTGVVYRLDGRETHASTPELGINPGLAVAEIIQRLSQFNNLPPSAKSINPDNCTSGSPRSGETSEFRQSTLICVRVGEPAFGTSAGHADVMFTLRAFTNAEMERLLSDANRAVDEIASRHNLTVSRSLVDPFRATENNPDCVNAIKKAVEKTNASDNSHLPPLTSHLSPFTSHLPPPTSHLSPLTFHLKDTPFRWSEDFAEYLQLFPGAMFGIGSGEEHPELHHPDYDFPDELIEPAAQLFFVILRQSTTNCPACFAGLRPQWSKL